MRGNVRLRARTLFPVSAPALTGGVITVARGRIVDVRPAGDSDSVIDLGDVAILPGLVNAHTHLEFSDLATPLGSPGQPFVDWIRDVIHHRAEHATDVDAAISTGLDECLRSGTTVIGEIATAGWSAAVPPVTPADVTVFRELRGMSDQRTADALRIAREHANADSSCSWSAGLSPHAPYSVGDGLFDEAVALSATHRIPLAFHLAESPEEVEFLQSRSGPFRKLLEDLGAWDAVSIAANRTPTDYLERLANATRGLVIHGNYLDSAAIDFMAERSSKLTLVYCPRTHAYFGHQRHPAAELLRRGGSVALGTDSRASNPDLDLWAEMRFAAACHPNLRPADVMRMGTLAGAAALGLGNDAGSLEAGKRADLTIVTAVDSLAINDETDLLTGAETRVVATVINGVARHVDDEWFQSLAADAKNWLSGVD